METEKPKTERKRGIDEILYAMRENVREHFGPEEWSPEFAQEVLRGYADEIQARFFEVRNDREHVAGERDALRSECERLRSELANARGDADALLQSLGESDKRAAMECERADKLRAELSAEIGRRIAAVDRLVTAADRLSFSISECEKMHDELVRLRVDAEEKGSGK